LHVGGGLLALDLGSVRILRAGFAQGHGDEGGAEADEFVAVLAYESNHFAFVVADMDGGGDTGGGLAGEIDIPGFADVEHVGVHAALAQIIGNPRGDAARLPLARGEKYCCSHAWDQRKERASGAGPECALTRRRRRKAVTDRSRCDAAP
jgi:hypothetical protein